jgi:hypothetical protein
MGRNGGCLVVLLLTIYHFVTFNNALERAVKSRGAPLWREAASWPAAQRSR